MTTTTITLCTLYRGHSAEYYHAAVKGKMSKKQKKELAKGMKLDKNNDEPDEMHFTELEVADTQAEVKTFLGEDDVISADD